MKLWICGAGAWGTALAVCAARSGHDVSLLVRDAAQAEQMQFERANARYLPGIKLPSALHILHGDAGSPIDALADLMIIATPMASLRSSLQALGRAHTPVAWLCKGFDAHGLLGHEISALIAREETSVRTVGVLSGPSFAQEVAEGRPTALVAASDDAALRDALVQAFHSER